jgi:dienelactone hydrolase
MVILRIVAMFVITLPVLAQGISERLEGHIVDYVPVGDGPIPAVLAVPGCSGISLDSPSTDRGGGSPTDPYFRRHYPQIAAQLRDEGYAVFLLDYHTAEGVVSACRGEVPPRTVAAYIHAAIGNIAANSRINAERIYLVGWSLGGAGLLNAVSEMEHKASPVKKAIAIYPGCRGVPPWTHDLPVYFFLGEADDITPAETCRSLAQELNAEHVAVFSYPDAHHGYDLHEAPPSISTGRGTTVGYNSAAAEATWTKIREILNGND